VTNGIPLGCSLLLPVYTVNCVQTLKADEIKRQLVQISESKASFEIEKITLRGELEELKRRKTKAEEKLKETAGKGDSDLAELEDELEELCQENEELKAEKKKMEVGATLAASTISGLEAQNAAVTAASVQAQEEAEATATATTAAHQQAMKEAGEAAAAVRCAFFGGHLHSRMLFVPQACSLEALACV
jgi:predicted  nucleic acid-binding Zn-ribbon protein